ncbi:MAG: helix-turn-helix domain-containing protein [Candidatus Latescibacteria bacterium]|nr:helix-turn-helix domain-containing protein [Candidatus Latescibacterota bacterium]NIM21217.1 helix-turn-helix domain-containing protein [Candidatus Latescibacterota bacterium]NIM65471.1 helix-turn-helix domain-containing protein [Candidatus Latescibacterota bacterium]NIO01849.1 helix-turn-helix domain-containing protein [Candidatus Latescibacterota bacterium]NIO28499.1 helix-turn-helix domain-containing protein [Candidatus Latescibacterota bacterium]
MSKVWLLKRINVFEMLPPKAMSQLATLVEDRVIKKGDFVFRAEDKGDYIYMLKSGRVKISRFSKDGRELVLGVVEPGEMFGEEAIPGLPRKRSAFAEVLEDAIICRLRVEEFNKMLKEFPDLSVEFTKLMSERLEEARNRMEDFVFRSIPERLAGFLLSMSEKHGEKTDRGIHINTKITHQEIASRIGSTRETVTAALNEFKRKNIIASDKRKLVITDKEALQKIYAKNAPEGERI